MASQSTCGDLNTLGQRVRHIRRTNRLTQEQLATRMRVTQARISQIENDTSINPMPLRTLYDLADALGVDLAVLIAGDPVYELTYPQELGWLSVSPLDVPRVTSHFFDRAADIAAILDALRGNKTHLLSLVGPAGVGKTQLTLHAAQELQTDFPNLSVVSLATCTDIASVLNTVARTIGIRQRDEQPLRGRLISALRERETLLLLDNLEQVLPAASTLAAELVASCPNLRLLVTSRAPLHIRDELTYFVRPLGLPETVDDITLVAAAASPAVQMFVQRAAVAVPGFSLTEQNAAKVAAICRRLDGLPLAIELAAPRTNVLTLDQLLAQLDRQLDVLTSGPRDLPIRQQSLRAAIGWSVDLLEPDLQSLFRRLGVFVEGFTLEAAIDVTSGYSGQSESSSDIPSSADTLANDLAVLLEQSLLTRTEQCDGVPRFRMLESIHEFALEQLEASAEAPEIHSRHLDWYLRLAEQSVSRMYSAGETEWLARLQREDANVQAALSWAFGPGLEGAFEAGLRLAGALGDYWFLSGHLSEGRAWLTRGIALHPNRAPTIGRARCLVGAGLLEQTQSAIELADTHARSAHSMALELDDGPTIGRALLLRGNVALMRGDLVEAQNLHAEALACFRRLADLSWTALALLNLGLDSFRQGELDEAERFATDALELARNVGDRWDTLNALYLLGDVARQRGDLERSHALFSERLGLSWRYGSDRDVADSLSATGAIAVGAGDLKRAARLFGASERLYQRLEITVPPPLRPDWNEMVAAVRRGLPADALSELWSSTSPEQATLEVIGLRQAHSG